ncbi:MAG: SNF1-interacting protein [Chaenotheca gracillima]|nr:MAG: SNF1-interacting protein [Chaenotheca gracillima]
MSTTAPPMTLLDFLSNTLILYHTTPYLPVPALYALGSTSRSFHSLVFQTPQVFRNVDLSIFKKTAATPFEQIDSGGVFWRNQQMDEAITEEDFYSGPLRGLFGQLRRKHILQDVQTLILDGLSVPAELIREIISDEPFNIRTLSIREAKNLNEHKLMQVLRYAVRPSRPEGSPRLRCLYLFGPKGSEVQNKPPLGYEPTAASAGGVTSSVGAQIGAEWNHKSQKSLLSSLSHETSWWYSPGKKLPFDTTLAESTKTLQDSEGIIAFDAVLCRGPRHDPSKGSSQLESFNVDHLPPMIANYALPSTGCARCHSSPEGPAHFSMTPLSRFPLFAPPPLFSSDPRVAQIPPFPDPALAPLYLRCEACLLDRVCERCHRWWCEDCYSGKPERSHGTTLASSQAEEALSEGRDWGEKGESSIKVHLGFCVDGCLVEEMMAGSGEGGMWG